MAPRKLSMTAAAVKKRKSRARKGEAGKKADRQRARAYRASGSAASLASAAKNVEATRTAIANNIRERIFACIHKGEKMQAGVDEAMRTAADFKECTGPCFGSLKDLIRHTAAHLGSHSDPVYIAKAKVELRAAGYQC